MTVIERETETRTATDAAVLERAAALLEEFGWCQGTIGSKDEGQFCLVGAVCEAFDDLDAWSDGNAGVCEALRAVGVPFRDHSLSAAIWNDAPGRTKAEVVAKLREAARIARAAEASV